LPERIFKENMTSSEIRQSFLDFFKSKKHTLVPSASLMPDSPNLLFTNAGMNQFVPIFLGQQRCPYEHPRAADTQKCIRAGGKHNDLDDVGMDTYHHTFFEMLGNWSFGDYFKREAIDWAWELLTEVWGLPKRRLYATVYQPGPGDPAEFDHEAYEIWAEKFIAAGLDPKTHIVNGNKKDNFWMMGDTGPCGPCSEVHMDLTPEGDTRGKLVNADSPLCIEIWNLVFIQFNANADGSFSPLPARHVDTGMGFERVANIIQNSNKLTDFSGKFSNYETDVFQPYFEALERISGKKYNSTLPEHGSSLSEVEKIDVAFRVIADHIRTLGFSIADGIEPGNTGRNYVLRRILRRAVRYGRNLGLTEPFFYQLTDTLADCMGPYFPELVQRREHIKKVIQTEEESFNKTLDRGIELFQKEVEKLDGEKTISGKSAFTLYDTFGFPLDLTEVMAREIGLKVDQEGFDKAMDEQKKRAKESQKKEIIEVSDLEFTSSTRFHGFEDSKSHSQILDVLDLKGRRAVVLNQTPFYASMGGQLGDEGWLVSADGNRKWRVLDTTKVEDTFLHHIEATSDVPEKGEIVDACIDLERRRALERHHTVTHILHWALHEVVSSSAGQKGSYVGPEKLTFDFNQNALTPNQLEDLERLVNEKIRVNDSVSWMNIPYKEAQLREDIMQFFGDKYGDDVRVVQIGGKPGSLDGYSMELCGGTHTRASGELGLFKIISEGAVAAGIRRIEAVCGAAAYESTREELNRLQRVAKILGSPVAELEKKAESWVTGYKDLEKSLRQLRAREAAAMAQDWLKDAQSQGALQFLIKDMGETDPEIFQAAAEAIKSSFDGVAALVGSTGPDKALVAACVSKNYTKSHPAGKIVQWLCGRLGGKGGGKPDFARGGAVNLADIQPALEELKVRIKETEFVQG
jgi:alanyl-tRNA synthetase